MNYLTGRKQRVVIKGQASTWHYNSAGVPQGSILGPLLFLIYVDDIVNDIESQILLFADDTSLFEIISDPLISFPRINNDLEKLNSWAKTWLVTFNPTKTKYMIFSKKLVKVAHPPLILDNKQLTKVSHHSQLGIVLSEDMTWNEHIKKACEKAGKRISAMIRISDKIDKSTKLNIYISFIRPTLEYGSMIFDNASQEMINLLEAVQRRAALTITGAYKCTKHTNLLDEIGLNPLKLRRTFFKLTLFYKIKNNLTLQYLSILCPPEVAERTDYNLRNAGNTDIIASNKNYYLKSFLPSTIKLWNNLPGDIRNAGTLDIFKHKLSAHLNMTNVYKPYLFCPNKNFVQIARLRMGLSALNAHRHKVHFIPNASCPYCNHRIEDTAHYLLQCPHFTAARTEMLNAVANILPDQYQYLLQINTRKQTQELSKILIFGVEHPETDFALFNITAIFIGKTARFV